MAVVALRLSGPLQSWGSGSRFVRRDTESAPTKSGILGLVAAAQGRRRADPIEDLVGLHLGIRVDQPGQLVRDFQTAIRREPRKDGSVMTTSMPLSYRFYLGDAVFVALLEGSDELIEGIDDAIRRPTFPLYLGRRSCPPASPIALGVHDAELDTLLATMPWMASRHHQRRHRDSTVILSTVRDAEPLSVSVDLVRDHPLSFDPHRRTYGWRRVEHGTVTIANPLGTQAARAGHDPMAVLGG